MEPANLLNFGVQHATPWSSCLAPRDGPQNVDGRCVLGGELAPASLIGPNLPSTGTPASGCSAYPIFYTGHGTLHTERQGLGQRLHFSQQFKILYATQSQLAVRSRL